MTGWNYSIALVGRGKIVDHSLRDHARDHLAGYKVPKQFLAVHTLHRTVAGKPDYRRPRELAIGLTHA
jgi:3-oxocholest-4-en-26-oate---CoA ligase